MLTPDDIFRAHQSLAMKRKERGRYTQFTPRRADKNQPAIVKSFRQLGAKWTHTHGIGGGVWDGVAAIEWLSCWVEIKDGDKPPSARRFTEPEREWGHAWPGLKGVALNTDDVGHIINGMRLILNGVKLPSYQLGNQEAQYRL